LAERADALADRVYAGASAESALDEARRAESRPRSRPPAINEALPPPI
jgi:hypothetical protein